MQPMGGWWRVEFKIVFATVRKGWEGLTCHFGIGVNSQLPVYVGTLIFTCDCSSDNEQWL